MRVRDLIHLLQTRCNPDSEISFDISIPYLDGKTDEDGMTKDDIDLLPMNDNFDLLTIGHILGDEYVSIEFCPKSLIRAVDDRYSSGLLFFKSQKPIIPG